MAFNRKYRSSAAFLQGSAPAAAQAAPEAAAPVDGESFDDLEVLGLVQSLGTPTLEQLAGELHATPEEAWQPVSRLCGEGFVERQEDGERTIFKLAAPGERALVYSRLAKK